MVLLKVFLQLTWFATVKEVVVNGKAYGGSDQGIDL